MKVTSKISEPGLAFRLSTQLVARLDPLGSEIVVSRGEVLFQQGAPCGGVFLLRSGSAQLTMRDDAGKTITDREVGPGSILGLPATLCQQPYMFTATARERCSFGYIETQKFQAFLLACPEVCMEIVQLMSHEVAMANRKRSGVVDCEHADCALRQTCTKLEPK